MRQFSCFCVAYRFVGKYMLNFSKGKIIFIQMHTFLCKVLFNAAITVKYPFLHTLQLSESHKFSAVLKGYQKGILGNKKVYLVFSYSCSF